MSVPYAAVGDEQTFSLEHFRAAPLWTDARNSEHVACTRGRLAVCCRHVHVRLTGASFPVTIPLIATPHEKFYRVQLEFGARAFLSGHTYYATWTVDSSDTSGGHPSAAQPAMVTPIVGNYAGRPTGNSGLSDNNSLWDQDEYAAARPSAVLPALQPIGYQSLNGIGRILSGWLTHETAAGLPYDDRRLVLQVQAPSPPAGFHDLTPELWLMGIYVYGECASEDLYL